MPYLLRVELPDVPGSLGRVASAIGEAGGDIEAIEVVDHGDGTVVDDVLLEMAPETMPDSIVSACTVLDGVRVVWISRYAAGGNLLMDLEAVEELTAHPLGALDRLIELIPATFRTDWAARVRRPDPAAEDQTGVVVHHTPAAPGKIGWHAVSRAERIETTDENSVAAAAPLVDGEIVVVGRRGGPEILESELARLGHLVGLAVSISRS